jgi:hypothetical protein
LAVMFRGSLAQHVAGYVRSHHVAYVTPPEPLARAMSPSQDPDNCCVACGRRRRRERQPPAQTSAAGASSKDQAVEDRADHVGLRVTDAERSQAFYEAWASSTRPTQRHSPGTGQPAGGPHPQWQAHAER